MFSLGIFGQTFYFGNDLSYVNEMEDCGAVFKEGGSPKDVYQIFADHGTNLVRVRLWYKPTWQNSLVQPAGVKNQYSDFDDAKETIRRSKKAGMMVMLDVQLSDFWTDQGKQLIPAPWINVATDTALLADSVYNYVARVLANLAEDTLMPEVVKIGNETNGGILRHTTLNADYTVTGSISTSWARHAHLFNAAIKAVRDAGTSFGVTPKICLHYAGLSYIANWYQTLINNGVTDFDIMGFSYYYAWHEASIAELGSTIRSLKSKFPGYDVMVAETGYLWSTENFDDLGNIVTTPDPNYLPVCPEKQLEYMVDYTREVINSGGVGVVFWEPAWVSTACKTPWGTGSSHDHLVFFDPVNTNWMENGGGQWTEPENYLHNDYKKVTFKVSTEDIVVPGKMYITGDMIDWEILPMFNESLNLYNWATYLAEGDTGAFYFLNDSSWEARESVPAACANMYNTDRRYIIGKNDTVITYQWATCNAIGSAESVKVTFKVDMTGQDVSNGVWITGTMTGSPWLLLKMSLDTGNVYKYTFTMNPGDSGAYYFMDDNVWGSRESVPVTCATWWNTDRGYKILADTTYAFTWGTCLPLGSAIVSIDSYSNNPGIQIYPNPLEGNALQIIAKGLSGISEVKIMDISGRILIESSFERSVIIDKQFLSGTYFVLVENEKGRYFEKLVVR